MQGMSDRTQPRPEERMTRRTAAKRNGSRLRLAADIGGTFTDIAVFDDRTGKLSFGKALSTPHRLVEGINAGVVKAGSAYKSAGLFLHGSTIAINTILQRTGAKTALLITEGFRDIYEIGRINRPDAYNLFFRKHEPLVERALRFEVKERVLSDGEIETPLDEKEIEAFGRMLARLGVEATGGLYEADQAKGHCVHMLESGPAAGVIGTQALCHALGLKNAIAFDMGGTTAKAGVIHNGEALTTGAALIGGYDQALPVQIAMMDIFEVGTGGGSIARVEEGGLRVGPQSAGAAPGPACYGLGGNEPTVTDANLVLGRLAADRFLGGEMRLDLEAAQRTLTERVAKTLGMDVTAAADGILRIAATAMSYAVKGVTTERGLDAGDFALVAYGGAGPLHAVQVAREIGIRTVIVPTAPGVFSAFGMLFSDLRYDFVRTWFTRLEDTPFAAIERVYCDLERQGRAAIAGTSIKPQKVTLKRAADMRYVGQEHAVTVDLPLKVFERQDRRAIKRLFDAMHELRYGTSAPDERAEIVSLRSTVTGVTRKPPHERVARGGRAPGKAAFTGRRPVYLDGKFRPTPSYARAALTAGNRINGPALIEEHAATTVLLPGDRLEVDACGHLMIKVAGGR